MSSPYLEKVLVLGATGFIGNGFLENLLLEEKGEIIVLVRDKSKLSPLILNSVTILEGDLTNFDWQECGVKPDVVFHFARNKSSRFRSFGRRWAAFRGNRGNTKFLRYLNELENQVKLFYLSGSLMYGNGEHNEDSEIAPISFARDYYNAEKPFLENFDNLNITMIRVPWVIGYGSWFKGFYLDVIIKNQKVPLYGKGDGTMSFIDIKTLSVVLMKLRDLPYYKTINISFSFKCTFLEFSKLLAQYLNISIEQVPLIDYENAIKEAFDSNIVLKSNILEKLPDLEISRLDFIKKVEGIISLNA
jgi:nucleoside-diphosphate-sugar epimerase